jgi:hypothetical protein
MRTTEDHNYRAKRRRCGQNQSSATFSNDCCRTATKRSATLTHTARPVWGRWPRPPWNPDGSGQPRYCVALATVSFPGMTMATWGKLPVPSNVATDKGDISVPLDVPLSPLIACVFNRLRGDIANVPSMSRSRGRGITRPANVLPHPHDVNISIENVSFICAGPAHHTW